MKFKFNYTVGFDECDPAGVIFFSNVFTIAHKAYESFLAESNLYDSVFFNNELAFPIIDSSASFKKPIKNSNKIEVELFIKAIRNNAYSICYNFFSNSEKAVQVQTVHLCINKELGIKNNIPEELKDYLIGFLISEI